MKIFTVPVLAAIVLVSSFIAYPQNHSSILGKWNVDFDQTLELLSDYDQSRLDSLGTATIDQMRIDLNSQQFEFASDSVFTSTSAQGNFVGKWQISDDDLFIISSNGNAINHKIVSLDSESLILQIVPESNKTAYIRKILLVKNQ